MKFKVGDKVKVVRITHSNIDRRRYIGDIFVVKSLNPNSKYDSRLDEHYGCGCDYVFYADELELAEFTKADLEDGMVIEYYDGDRAMVIGDKLMGDKKWSSLNNFTDTLTHISLKVLTINKVYKSTAVVLNDYFKKERLTLIWERKKEEPIKEMTVAEIEKELGYKVKIKVEN